MCSGVNSNERVLLAVVVMVLALAGSACGKVIYVDDDAPPGSDGCSWTTAYTFLQDALTEAEGTQETVEIRIAQGTYKPDQGAGLRAGDKEATFRMLNGVTIKGGYAGPSRPDPNAWDPCLYETVLSGDLADNDDFMRLSTANDNSHHVVTASGTDATAVIEGVTIARGAYLPTLVFTIQGGGGIYNRAGSPTIRFCTFSHNVMKTALGSAMVNFEGAAAHLEGCTFENNHGYVALYDKDSATLLTNCQFIENHGVAIQEENSQIECEGCSFTNNWSIALSLGEDCQATVSNCDFTGNRNAISGTGGTSVICTDSVFVGNTRERDVGGAVGVHTGTFVRCSFRDNFGGGGGAIYGISLTLEDCTFVRNSAVSYGAVGCVYADIHGCLFAGNRGLNVGALDIYKQGKLTNCTVVGNRAAWGGVVDLTPAETTVTNCIIRDNFCEDTFFGEIEYSRTTISFSCVAPPPWQLKELGYVRDGLMDVDPCFVDPGYWDPNGTPDDPNDDFWVEGDYHLKSQAGRWDPNSQSWVQDDVTSPCIDAGDPNSPAAFEPFPNGGIINMGAYGGTAEASKSYFGQPLCETGIAGDINGDCKVDFKDLVILLNHWLESGERAEE